MNIRRLASISLGDLFTRLLFCALGLLLLLPAAYKLGTYLQFRTRALAVDGVILESSQGRDMGARPLVEYEDRQGRLYERKSRAKTHWFFAPRAGEKVKVFYDPQDPSEAIVDSAFHYVLLPLGLIWAGAACLV